MTAKIESLAIHAKLQELLANAGQNDQLIRDKFQKFMDEHSNAVKEEEQKKLLDKQTELMDTKVHNAFEKLRNDNLYIWKQSIELAEKEFNTRGVTQTMNFLPKTLLDRNDLKRTVNSLILEENYVPKPVLNQDVPEQLVPPKKEQSMPIIPSQEQQEQQLLQPGSQQQQISNKNSPQQ